MIFKNTNRLDMARFEKEAGKVRYAPLGHINELLGLQITEKDLPDHLRPEKCGKTGFYDCNDMVGWLIGSGMLDKPPVETLKLEEKLVEVAEELQQARNQLKQCLEGRDNSRIKDIRKKIKELEGQLLCYSNSSAPESAEIVFTPMAENANADEWRLAIYKYHRKHPSMDQKETWSVFRKGLKISDFTIDRKGRGLVLVGYRILERHNFMRRWRRYVEVRPSVNMNK